jgi:hypothetical protein
VKRRYWAVVEKSTGKVRVPLWNIPAISCKRSDARAMCPLGDEYVVREVYIRVKRTGSDDARD